MSIIDQKTQLKKELKTVIKKGIAKAWYELDSQSYEVWLEGRKAQQRQKVSV